MEEYIVTLRLQVDKSVLNKYQDVSDMIYDNTLEVPFSFDIENIHNNKENNYGCKKTESNNK